MAGNTQASRIAAVLLLSLLPPAAQAADPIVVAQPLAWRELRSPNNINSATGDLIKVGALFITPNPFHGNNGSVGTSVKAIGPDGVEFTLPFQLSPASPDEFSTSRVPFTEARRECWTLVITNPESANSPLRLDCVTSRIERADGSAPGVSEFVHDMSMSGSGTDVTFHFQAPAGSQHNGINVRIFDRDTPNFAVVHISPGLAANATSYTVPAVINGFGEHLRVGGRYAAAIQLQEFNAGRLVSRSISFFDFTPLPAGSPPSVELPMVGTDNVYHFNAAVVEGQAIFIDPEVATAYEYAIGAGDPRVRSIILPHVGDDIFEVYYFEGGNWHDAGVAHAGVEFPFAAQGVERFIVTGIEASAGLDPANTSAFATGLTFVSSGRFTGTMTPRTTAPDVTPPVITPVLSGPAGSNGWYVGPVTVSWQVVDAQSAITSAPCPPALVSADTNGAHVSCSASSEGGTSTNDVVVKIDSTPPSISCSAAPSLLWPPNGAMIPVTTTVVVDDAMSGADGYTLLSVTGSEDGSSLGSTEVSAWIVGTPDTSGTLRARRDGSGIGRTYTLAYRGRDRAGNTAVCETVVAVPHDRGK